MDCPVIVLSHDWDRDAIIIYDAIHKFHVYQHSLNWLSVVVVWWKGIIILGRAFKSSLWNILSRNSCPYMSFKPTNYQDNYMTSKGIPHFTEMLNCYDRPVTPSILSPSERLPKKSRQCQQMRPTNVTSSPALMFGFLIFILCTTNCFERSSKISF